MSEAPSRARRLGVVTRYREHAAAFSPAFWEVKDVGGAWIDPPPGAIPMVSCFGDNRLGRAHPDWIQVDQEGTLATRESRYFDWTAICPSQEPVRAQAQSWVQKALEQSGGQDLRLDDVSFARDGYCRCPACLSAMKESGSDWSLYRQDTLTEFVRAVRPLVSGRLYLTLYPDPYPGHLEERFGLDIDRLKGVVDAFVLPIYDLAYSTTYWLEVLARGFVDRLAPTPWLLELYGLDVAEAALGRAVDVAAFYADRVVIAYDSDLDKLKRLEARLQRE